MGEIITTPKKKSILEKKGIYTNEDLLNFLPRAYKDYSREFTEISIHLSGSTGCFLGEPSDLRRKYNNKRSVISFKLRSANNYYIHCTIIGQDFMYNVLDNMMNHKEIAVFGTITHSEDYGFSIMQPELVTYYGTHKKHLGIKPVYTKFSGISEDGMKELIDTALAEYDEKDIADKEMLERYGLFKVPATKEAYRMLHKPASMNIADAKYRLKINKLLHFALTLEENTRKEAKGTHIILNNLTIVADIIKNLPYKLTVDQNKYLKEMINNINAGKRVSALLQGDVSCGKTMVAILMLFAMAENGYQGVLMAPTSILAEQHYEEIKKYADKYGVEVAYLNGTVSTKEKKRIAQGLSSATIKIVVGTQSLASTKITYGHLGMVIIDEEHRFGVEQRDVLLSHAQEGVNTLVMSATPMPRTLAGAVHGNNTEIYDIKTMPAERIPVQTAINNSDAVIMNFIEEQLIAGRQAYVVCPLIEHEEEKQGMENVRSVQETVELYKDRFEPFYPVAVLNGKMKEAEVDEIIKSFKENKTSILISTTVIEVGVNNTNASVIVISNAERFGLATMHQLRGRVGRGSHKSYCILQSSDKENERLQTMVNCRDGFTIAQEDLKLRGAGDIIGVKQSGVSEYIDLIQEEPKLYETCCKMAVEILNNKKGLGFLN
ncbi:MAG: DEAD/DEAH box helicase [Lachnospiraceae bacterium]|nr:DEAD/DEAH box helicase [Lachnospiraceae bacterium]